jgi:hypothetical protein
MPDTLEGTFGEPVHENPKQHKLHNSHSLRFDIFVYSLNDYSCIPIPCPPDILLLPPVVNATFHLAKQLVA